MQNARNMALLAFGIWHSALTTLRSYHRPIASSCRSPRVIEIGRRVDDREFRGDLFVHLDAEARLLPREHVAVLHLRASHEDVLRLRRKAAALVDAEVVARELQRQLRGVRDRRCVTGPVPGRADAEVLAERRDLARRTQPADLRDVDADEINQ